MNNINFNSKINPFKVDNNTENSKNKYNIGTIIEATITNKDNNFSTLKISNTEIQVKNENIVGEVGEKISFEVKGFSDNQVTLKQINKKSSAQEIYQKTEKAKDDETIDMFKQNNIYKEYDNTGKNVDPEQEKAEMAIREIERSLKFISNNASSSAITKLLAQGVDLNKISLPMLNGVMTEINSKPVLEKPVEETGKTENIDTSEKIKIALEENGLPVKKENIASIEKNLNKYSSIKNKALPVMSIIKDETPLTLDNIHVKNFTRVDKTNVQAELDLVDLDTQISDLLLTLDMPVTEENINLAKDFIAQEIPVNKDNFEKYFYVENQLKNLDEDYIIQKTIDIIKSENKTLDIDLSKTALELDAQKATLYENNLNTINLLENIKDENISFLIDNNEEINLKNIKIAVNNNLESNSQHDLVAFRKNLAEIQLKLTSEVAYRLSEKGIDIDTAPLMDTITTLRNIEDEINTQYFKNINVTPVNSDLEAMASFQNVYNSVSPIPLNVYTDILTNKVDYTFSGINKSSSMAKALENYELLKTDVSPKYKDNFSKIKEQIQPLLESLDIEPSDENISSAEILIRNNIEVTAENINKTAELYTKINNLYDTLHPNIVAKMISESINPLEMDIDEMLLYSEKYSDIYGKNVSDNIAEHLVDLSKDKNISEDNMASIKAIYRTLNQILKNNGKALGNFLNTGMSLTLENLLNFSKVANNKNEFFIDTTVDDQLAEKISAENSIKNLVAKSIEDINNSLETTGQEDPTTLSEFLYKREILNSFVKEGNPSSLNQLMQETENFDEELVNSLVSKLKELNFTKGQYSETAISDTLNSLAEILSVSPATINFLAKNNILDSMDNISNFKKLLKAEKKTHENYSEKTLSKSLEFSEDVLHDDSTINIMVGEMENEIFETSEPETTLEVLDLLNLQNSLNHNTSNFYSKPIKLPISGEGTFINVYLLDKNFENKETQKIAFSLNTSNLGKIQALATVNNNSLDLDINMENNTYTLDNIEQELKTLISGTGFNLNSLSINENINLFENALSL